MRYKFKHQYVLSIKSLFSKMLSLFASVLLSICWAQMVGGGGSGSLWREGNGVDSKGAQIEKEKQAAGFCT